MGANGKPKTYAIKKEELDALVDQAANAGIDAYKQAERKAKGKALNRNLYNTRKLLESYRTLKNDLQHSDYETEDAQKELRFKCVEDLMKPGETHMEDVMAKEIARLQENAWRKRQIERALELLKEDCSRPGTSDGMRKYRVLMATYIQDEIVSQEDIADAEHVSDRTVRYDIQEALKMITPYLFSIESIMTQP